MKYKVYKITNQINGRMYVGLTTTSLQQRFYQHKNSKSQCAYLNKAIQKYGSKNFKIDLLQAYETKEEMQIAEARFILELNTLSPNGYNLTTGGEFTTFATEVKEKMSENMTKRWNNGDLKLRESLKLAVNARKLPIVGVNITTGIVIRFESGAAAKKQGLVPNFWNKTTYTSDHVWFYDEGFTDKDYQDLAKEKMGCNFGEYRRGMSGWNEQNRESRVKSLIEGSRPNMKPIVAVHAHSGNVVHYESIHAAMRDGYSTYGIYACLNGQDKTGQKNCWFYHTGLTNEQYKAKALELVGSFKTDFTNPIIAISPTGETINFKDVYEASKSTGFLVKVIRRKIKESNGKFKGWTFTY